MQCPKCNSLVLDGSRFCVNCGCQLINDSKTNGQKTMAQQLGLNNSVIVDTPQQLKAAINKNCAEIYLTDKSLSDEMGLFSSPTAALAWAVLLLVALFNGLAIIAYLAILIAVICHGLAFLRFFLRESTSIRNMFLMGYRLLKAPLRFTMYTENMFILMK